MSEAPEITRPLQHALEDLMNPLRSYIKSLAQEYGGRDESEMETARLVLSSLVDHTEIRIRELVQHVEESLGPVLIKYAPLFEGARDFAGARIGAEASPSEGA
jgi:hypothetical protein